MFPPFSKEEMTVDGVPPSSGSVTGGWPFSGFSGWPSGVPSFTGFGFGWGCGKIFVQTKMIAKVRIRKTTRRFSLA